MTDKPEALQKALDNISKRWGKEAVTFGSDIKDEVLDVIPTGSVSLDALIGGGLPRKKITVVYGGQSSGKSTLTIEAATNAQRAGLNVAYIRMEGWLPPDYCANIGLDMDKLLVSRPNNGEQALQTAQTLAESGAVALVVIDSVPALIPERRVTGGIGTLHHGDIALLLSNALPELSLAAEKGNCAIVLITQSRVTQGAQSSIPGYVPTHPYGGQALQFWGDLIIKMTRRMDKEAAGRLKRQGAIARIEKSRVSRYANHEASFIIEFGEGIDRIADLASFAIARGVIEDKGAGRYSFGETKWHGIAKLTDDLRENEELRKELESRVR